MHTFSYFLPRFMEEILVFAAGLDEARRKELLAVLAERKTMSARILRGLLEGKGLRPQIERELSTTPSTFNKACTEAKHELIEEVKKLTNTPFDDIYLLKTLVLAGHFSAAQKYAAQLEKLFETKQQWQHLELLHIEVSRLCQATGDLKLTATLSQKRIRNATRLRVFIELSTELNKLLFEFEVYEKKKLPTKFVRQLKLILKKTQQLGHFTLIHNALQLQYLYYSRYTNDHALAKKFAGEIYKNREKHKENLNEITSVLALNAYLNCLFIYNGRVPEQLVDELKDHINVAGKHAEVNFYYAYMDHLLFEGRSKELNEMLRSVHLDDNTKFTVYRHSIEALKYFSEENYAAFRESTNIFYKDTSRLDFPEVECMLRIVEIIWLIAEAKEEDALYKLNSLRVFIGRNLSERFLYEKEMVSMLTKYVNKRMKPAPWKTYLDHLQKASYRNISFLGRLLEKELI